MATKKQSKPTVVDFAEIRRRRLAAGWTFGEIATRAGWDPNLGRVRWSDLERGRFDDPRISTLVEMAEALSCRVDDLLLPRK